MMTPYNLAESFMYITEAPGEKDNPYIMSFFHSAGAQWAEGDEVPWCSAFVYHIAHLYQLDRPPNYQLRARSWLMVGVDVLVADARVGFDIVILKRGGGQQPGSDVYDAPGHVGFYSGQSKEGLYVLGGNQSNSVNIRHFDFTRLLSIRRLVNVYQNL